MAERNVTNNTGLKTEKGRFLNDLPKFEPFPRPVRAPCGGPVFAGGQLFCRSVGHVFKSAGIGLTPADFRRKLASMMSAVLD
jgi:hypothetical protein